MDEQRYRLTCLLFLPCNRVWDFRGAGTESWSFDQRNRASELLFTTLQTIRIEALEIFQDAGYVICRSRESDLIRFGIGMTR